VPVVELREVEGRAVRHEALRALLVGPAVVRAADAAVDLLPRVGVVAAHVADPHRPVHGVEHEAERVAEAVGPDLRVDAREPHERIVGRDRAVGADTEDLPVLDREVLPVRRVELIAGGDVEAAVRAEVDRAAVVVVGGLLRVLPDQDLARRVGRVAHDGEASDAVPGLERRVVDVEEAVRREARVERHAHEAALAADRVDARDLHQRPEERRALVHEDAAPALADEEPAVGRELHDRRLVQAGRDDRALEARGQRRGGGDRSQGERGSEQGERDSGERHDGLLARKGLER
jgi:hypothetical protein